MNIAVVGLGLIGGSVCKALKANTFHHIMGMDTDKETVRKALEQGAIDEEIDESRLGEANLTVVALYPVPTVEFVKKNADRFKKGSIVIDVGGVKGYVVNGCTPILDEKGVYFLGTHPMAGTENSGFDYSKADMFVKASYILTPTESTDISGALGFLAVRSLRRAKGFCEGLRGDSAERESHRLRQRQAVRERPQNAPAAYPCGRDVQQRQLGEGLRPDFCNKRSDYTRSKLELQRLGRS